MKSSAFHCEPVDAGRPPSARPLRLLIVSGCLFLAACIGSTAPALGQSARPGTAPKGANRGPADNFTGVVWVKPLVPPGSRTDCIVSEVTFEAKGRTVWHKHPNGQILVVTQGTGYYQEKGKPIRIIRQGESVDIAPQVVHWHGAGPNGRLTHIAIIPNVSRGGAVNWMQPVTDQEYGQAK
ncbi:cupin domain-containing protein [Larkinella soli]|uniref:cupin domain-containing protein n=1 Tax=Larkinella soli TaxID=1770527 RepID=UPI0019D2DD07|nr:cupin domain-containing protein [Larkinella soli]